MEPCREPKSHPADLFTRQNGEMSTDDSSDASSISAASEPDADDVPPASASSEDRRPTGDTPTTRTSSGSFTTPWTRKTYA